MRVRRLHRLVVHKPGIKVVAAMPCTTQAADDLPKEYFAEMLTRLIREGFERAPKRRSRGPYVLGPVSGMERTDNRHEDFIRGYTRFWASAEVRRA